MNVDVWTIGHGGRSLREMVELLKPHGIRWIVDVRSSPYSRYQPEFNREPLASLLEKEGGPEYLFLGDVLGGRPNDPEVYRDGHVDYDLCRTREWFADGIARLERGIDGHRIAIMCSESKPENCHRTKLIAVELKGHGYEIGHIDETGSLVSHDAVIDRITNGQQSFFGEETLRTSRGRYSPGESRLI